MTNKQVLDYIRRVVRDDLHCPVPVELETDLQGDLQLDSVDRLALVVALENGLEVCLDLEDEAEAISTVADLVERIAGELEGAKTSEVDSG